MKRVFRFSYFFLALGWIFFMFLCAWGSNLETLYRLNIIGVGLFFLITGSIFFMKVSTDTSYWEEKELMEQKKKELDKKYEEADKLVEAVKRLSARKFGITKANLEEEIKSLD